MEKRRATIVAPIDWKESFYSYPSIVFRTVVPVEYRVLVEDWTKGGTLKITAPISSTIDDWLMVLEGCFLEGSNLCNVLEDYYGKMKLEKIQFDFAGINSCITRGQTAEEAKNEFFKKKNLAG